MKPADIVLLVFLLGLVSVECFLRPKVRQFPTPVGEDSGKPLFLTPLILAGKIMKAQRLSRVRPHIGNTTSYSGYLTTDKKCGNNLFFWFFPAQNDWKNAPLVLWLQGGPGASSMFGLFEELGPFNSFESGLKARQYSWNVKNNLLFIDQPVGTGYSFTTAGCYAETMNAVGANLYSAIVQFLKLFPVLQKNKFFITGESFGGHFVPTIGHTIHKKNPTAKLKVNLVGMMIGDGWTDPREQINYADYVYQAGLVDDSMRDEMYYYQKQFVKQVDAKDWADAVGSWDNVLNLFNQYAGVSLYNYLPQPRDDSNWDKFISSSSTRKAIHVGSTTFYSQSDEVYYHLQDTLAQSVKPWVEELLEVYPIIFYAGEVDVICAYPMMINFLRSLKWSGQSQYLNASRMQWKEGDDIAGYIKGTKNNNLFDVLVRDAGHMVPADQPFWAYQLVNSFTTGHGSHLSRFWSHENDGAM